MLVASGSNNPVTYVSKACGGSSRTPYQERANTEFQDTIPIEPGIVHSVGIYTQKGTDRAHQPTQISRHPESEQSPPLCWNLIRRRNAFRVSTELHPDRGRPWLGVLLILIPELELLFSSLTIESGFSGVEKEI